MRMNNSILIGIIVIAVVVAGYFVYQNYTPVSPVRQMPSTNFQKEDSQFLCNSDDECILKTDPYCCSGYVEHIDRCYHTDEEPPIIEQGTCDPNGPCPSQEIPKACKCENNKCVNVYK